VCYENHIIKSFSSFKVTEEFLFLFCCLPPFSFLVKSMVDLKKYKEKKSGFDGSLLIIRS